MAQLVGIAGSLRAGSYNKALLNAAAQCVPQGSSLVMLSIDQVPLYNADVEADGTPEQVMSLRSSIREADGLVISTPEYNSGVPGVLKNVIDWISRPVEGEASVFVGKPLAMMGATPGGLGTALSQAAWLPTLRSLRLMLWTGGGNFMLSRASGEFHDGRLTDDKLRNLESFMAGFVDFVDG